MADNPPNNGRSNGGIIGGVTKVAEKTVGALAGFPMLLVLTLLNAGMFGMMTYLIIKSAEYRYAERQELVKILSACFDDRRKQSGFLITPPWDSKEFTSIEKQ